MSHVCSSTNRIEIGWQACKYIAPEPRETVSDADTQAKIEFTARLLLLIPSVVFNFSWVQDAGSFYSRNNAETKRIKPVPYAKFDPPTVSTYIPQQLEERGDRVGVYSQGSSSMVPEPRPLFQRQRAPDPDSENFMHMPVVAVGHAHSVLWKIRFNSIFRDLDLLKPKRVHSWAKLIKRAKSTPPRPALGGVSGKRGRIGQNVPVIGIQRSKVRLEDKQEGRKEDV
ncbi:hypothetical protein C8R45DRAFT_937810 [Mycena sanguinolenta]|nr:hypothetical protein C8R45DRAFT_937810 [Mycena sanguinolenta]